MSSNNNTLNQLNQASATIVIIGSIINFILGAIGLISNILVFTRPVLRHEPCSLYFLSSTCFSLFVIFIIIPTRVFSEGFYMDLAIYNLSICKIQNFVFYVMRTISIWLIVFACVDRYLHSARSQRIRQLSSKKTAKFSISITIIFVFILYIHMLVFYDIVYVFDRFGNRAPTCRAQSSFYRIFLGFWYMLWYSFCPCLFMFFFGFLTLHNIRHRSQIIPTVNKTNQMITRRTDTQLSRMLTVQVFVIAISTLPLCIYRVYAAFTINFFKGTLQLAQENLALQIANIMTFFAHSSSFYLYTLTGTVFRREFLEIIRHFTYHRNRI